LFNNLQAAETAKVRGSCTRHLILWVGLWVEKNRARHALVWADTIRSLLNPFPRKLLFADHPNDPNLTLPRSRFGDSFRCAHLPGVIVLGLESKC